MTAGERVHAVPGPDEDGRIHPAAADPQALLSLNQVRKHFPIRSGVLQRKTGAVKAVDGISLSVRAGETLGRSVNLAAANPLPGG